MNIANLLFETARWSGDRTAFRWDEGSRTYGEAAARAGAMAAGLRALGVAPGDRVGLLMHNSAELLEAMFAAWGAGACVVPLNAALTREEIAYHVDDASMCVLVSDGEFSDKVAGLRGGSSLREIVTARTPVDGAGPRLDELVAAYEGSAPATEVDGAAPAWIMYTSGTSGRPKGAVLTHDNLTFITVGYLADVMPVEPGEVGLHVTPLTHGGGYHALAFTGRGAVQVLAPRGSFDPARFCRLVEKHRVAHVWLVPTQIKMLLRYPDLERHDLSSLRRVVYGGAPMYGEDLKEAVERLGQIFVQIFAQSETAMTGTYLPPAEHLVDDARRLTSCGRARTGVEVRVVDEHDVPQPPGTAGEVAIRAPSVMRGYWERPEETAETLRGGWLHTGDIGSLDEQGYLYVHDRARDLVITGGMNVYPREVEEALLQHRAVAQVCVVGVPDERWGEAVKALVVLEDGVHASEDEIIAFAGLHLAGYKKPKSVDFLEDLPKNAYGKVLRRELRAPFWAGRSRMVN